MTESCESKARLSTYTPLTQWSRSGLTVLSKHSVEPKKWNWYAWADLHYKKKKCAGEELIIKPSPQNPRKWGKKPPPPPLKPLSHVVVNLLREESHRWPLLWTCSEYIARYLHTACHLHARMFMLRMFISKGVSQKELASVVRTPLGYKMLPSTMTGSSFESKEELLLFPAVAVSLELAWKRSDAEAEDCHTCTSKYTRSVWL